MHFPFPCLLSLAKFDSHVTSPLHFDQVLYTCLYCQGTAADVPFNTFSPQLLDTYGSLSTVRLLYDNVVPELVLAIQSVYGRAGSTGSPYLLTESGTAFYDNSATVIEGLIALSNTSAPISSITVCCGAAGAASQVTLTFADGTVASAGSCPAAHRRVLQQGGGGGGGGAGPGAVGGTFNVPEGVGYQLSGFRGLRGAGVGTLSFALARRLPGELGHARFIPIMAQYRLCVGR